jgi:hypothetical protein
LVIRHRPRSAYLSPQSSGYPRGGERAPDAGAVLHLRIQGWESALTRQIDFAGKSGTIYRYTELDEQRPLPPAGANYVIAEVSDRGLAIVYAGETDNLARADWRGPLSQAREHYERLEVLTRLNVRSAVRNEELDDIIRQHFPPMNPQSEDARTQASAPESRPDAG